MMATRIWERGSPLPLCPWRFSYRVEGVGEFAVKSGGGPPRSKEFELPTDRISGGGGANVLLRRDSVA